MSASISLIGHLGKEPETDVTNNGTFVTKFSIASNSFKKTANGERVDKTDWFRVTAFGKQAETIAQYVRKGHKLFVQGPLTFNPWLDRTDSPQSGAEIILKEFEFLTPKEGGDNDGYAAEVSQQAYMPAPVQQPQYDADVPM